MRVVFVSAECEPFAKTGGLGDVVDALARALPRASGEGYAVTERDARVGDGGLQGVGTSAGATASLVDAPVDVFLPLYRGVNVPDGATRTRLRIPDPLSVAGFTDVTLVDLDARGYRVHLVDHPPAFDRADYYGGPGGDYPDNAWRFGLLCRAAIEAVRSDARPVDVFHLHDWQSTPVALYRDVAYADDPVIARAAVIVTIHNLAYQGWVGRPALPGLLFPNELARAVPEDADGLLLLRDAIERAELVNTVSPGYAREVLTPAFGMDMHNGLASLGDRFFGIINGLDMSVWDPATDAALPANYSRLDLTGKAACRRALLEELGFDPDDPSPLFGMIGRLDPQKGFDLLTKAAPAIIDAGARIVALGTGDKKLVAELQALASVRPESVAVAERFDRNLARRIYAGADCYLMPSRFEPCGQGQMISLRYGTPAVVHRTGGLADTVVDVDAQPDEGTGFVFDAPTAAAFADACARAVAHVRAGGQAWAALQDRGMSIDWSWEGGPAQQYAAAYVRAREIRRRR